MCGATLRARAKDEMKTALITGITGQDGHHLTKFLLGKNYQIVGIVSGQRKEKAVKFLDRFPQVKLISGDLADFGSLLNIIDEVAPDEIYNLGAISFVGLSFLQPEITANVTGLGALRILEAVRKLDKDRKTRIYQASSSEMFGQVRQSPQNELTPFHPRSPYGVAKTFAHYTSVNYREAYGMHISCGILFNHEGEFRGHEFVTRKISSNIAKIKLGKSKSFSLGSLEPKRDWGYAGDFVEAMWLMVQQQEPSDYVISTGEVHSVKDFVLEAMKVAGLGSDLNRFVTYDEDMTRPSEVSILLGDCTKAKEILGWTPRVSFEQLVHLMVENDLILEAAL